jgi:predicted Zn-dependent protease
MIQMKRNILFLAVFAILFAGCSKVPFTNRKQAKLLPESEMNAMSFAAYQDFLKINKLSTNTSQTNMVKSVGQRIESAATNYYTKKNLTKKLEGYNWEFNLVDDPTVNAWCMPGGKVVFYSGIMPVCKTADGVAVVMGHEIAHALAHHGNERMSQGLMLQLGGIGLAVALSNKPQETQNLFMTAYGVGATLGAMLPFSRLHESEADEIGLFLMAMAGYDPEESVDFWQRMSASGGAQPPQFLSTHPSHEKRIADLKALIPKAKAYAQAYPAPGR